MKKNNNKVLLPAKKNKVALSIGCNNASKKIIALRHVFDVDRSLLHVRSVNVTTDNRHLIITFDDNAKIRVLDLVKLEFLPHKFEGHAQSVRLTSITKDNKYFFSTSWDMTTRKHELATGKCNQILSGFGRSPSVFVDEEQKLLFNASYDKDIDPASRNSGRCWDIESGKVLQIYKHTHESKDIECVDIAYDQQFVYTCSEDGIAYKWQLRGKKPLFKYFECEGSVRKIAVSAKYIAGACTDGKIRVHKKFLGEQLWCFIHGNQGVQDIRDVKISLDQTKLWSAADDGTICCFDLISGKQIYHRKIHKKWIWSICLMNNDKVLVTGSGDGMVAFVSANTGKILAKLRNLLWDDEIIITCLPDKAFPNGCFYATNEEFIQVYSKDKNRQADEELELNDPRRIAYIEKTNNKNLVITKLKNDGQYTALTKNHIKNQKMRKQVNHQKLPRLLMAEFK